MKKAFIILVTLSLSSCLNNSNSTIPDNTTEPITSSSNSEVSTTDAWYHGGTLHRAKIAEWKVATEENKLATCADFIAVTNNTVPMDELKSKAMDLKNCIDEATRGLKSTDNSSVASIASLCTVTLGYN